MKKYFFLLLLNFFLLEAFSSEPRIEIDRVEVQGVVSLSSQELYNAVEISSGDTFDKPKIIQTVDQLQSLYRSKGFEQVKIEVTQLKIKNKNGILDHVLRFNVTEGLPTRVASFRLVSDDPMDESTERVWKKFKNKIQSEIQIKENDIFDLKKINDTKKSIQDFLVGEEFVGVRVEHKKNTLKTQDKSSRWADLEFRVYLGDRVTFGFRGNSIFTHVQLLSMVDEQRVIGFGKDYLGAIRGRIIEEYRSIGFSEVSVKFTTREFSSEHRRHITYVIDEGQRVQIEEVEFDGNNVFTQKELYFQFFRRASNILSRGYYVEKDFQKAADLLVEWMKSKGYLASKIISINSVLKTSQKSSEIFKSVKITIYLYEGEQTLTGRIFIKGVKALTEQAVIDILQLKSDEPLNLFSFSEGIELLKSKYKSLGYLNVSIVNEGSDDIVQYTEENRVADVYLEVSEGFQYRVSQIIIDGLTQTDENIVSRELTFVVGDILTEPVMNESEEAIRKLGIFSSVSLHSTDDPQKTGFKVVRVTLQEGTPGVIAGGVGFRNDLGIRVFGRAAYTNVGGKNQVVFLNMNANRRFDNFHFAEYQAQVGYLWPWFGIDHLIFRPTFTVSGTQYTNSNITTNFDATTVSAALTWERRLLKSPNLTANFSYTLERILQFNAFSASDNQGLRIGTIGPSLRLDMRNNPLAPTSGLFAVTSFELAEPWLYSQTEPYRIGYYRYQLRTDYFLEILRNMTWFFSFRMGFEKNLEVGIDDGSGTGGRIDPETREVVKGIPLIKQFALGGVGSLRGFQEQEINQRNLAILGTLSYVNYRTQLDMPLIGALRFGPFLDAGNVLADDFSFGKLRWGAGFGFHYLTPVGPVNLDWGFNLFPQSQDRGLNQFYLSVGVI